MLALLSSLGITKRLAGIAKIGVVLAIIGTAWLLWRQRGAELAAAKARLAVVQTAQVQDQATIARLRAAQARSDAAQAQAAKAAAQVDAAASAIADATNSVSSGDDGPVAPVLSNTLARLRAAQGVK